MNPTAAARLALVLIGVGAAVWVAVPDEHWATRAVLVLTIVFVAGALFDLARFPGTSRRGSTMGPAGDALIGSRALVTSLDPLKVEARGALWSARLSGRDVSPREQVEVVGRDGFTLLVRAADDADVLADA